MVKNIKYSLSTDDSNLKNILLSYQEQVKIRSEPDFYGASKLISQHIGLEKAPNSFSSWSHGASFNGLKYVEQIVWNNSWQQNRLVANSSVKIFLENHGVDKVKAVGLPIVYTLTQNIKRRKKSVLIMLSHSLSYVQFEHKLSEVLDFCFELRKQDCYVCFCVHSDCFLQNSLTSELDKHNIDWFVGSSVDDPNSLQRMRNIFEYFEVVASNAIGSHFYYSQLFGAKFIFIEPYFEYKKEYFKNDPNWKGKPQVLSHVLLESSEVVVREKFANYFTEYQYAFCNQKLAELECGVHNKVDPRALSYLLGWSVKDQVISPIPYYTSKFICKVMKKVLEK